MNRATIVTAVVAVAGVLGACAAGHHGTPAPYGDAASLCIKLGETYAVDDQPEVPALTGAWCGPGGDVFTYTFASNATRDQWLQTTRRYPETAYLAGDRWAATTNVSRAQSVAARLGGTVIR
jgi:hypothetical protein